MKDRQLLNHNLGIIRNTHLLLNVALFVHHLCLGVFRVIQVIDIQFPVKFKGILKKLKVNFGSSFCAFGVS